MNLSKPERALFTTIWLVIVLVIGIYLLWPSLDISPRNKYASLTYTPELNRFFTKLTLKSSSEKAVEIGLELNPDYLASLSGKPSTLRIGYDLLKNENRVDQGVVPITLQPIFDVQAISLVPPRGAAFDQVRLYFAR